jgi:hypothetical protein
LAAGKDAVFAGTPSPAGTAETDTVSSNWLTRETKRNRPVIKKARRESRALDQTINGSNLPAIAATTTTATAAATVTTTSTAATATRTSAAASAGLVLSFVDAELAATHIVTVQALNGAGCIGLAHFNEPETTRASRFAIGRQRHGLDGPMLREQCANVRLAGAERQIAYIDFRHKFRHSPNNSKRLSGKD